MISGPINGNGPLPPDGMYHVSDSINGLNGGAGGHGEPGLIADKVSAGGDSGGGGDGDGGVGQYRRLPSSTCV